MNRSLPPRDRGYRIRDTQWESRPPGPLSRTIGLECGVADSSQEVNDGTP
jgi:hypothetical protein